VIGSFLLWVWVWSLGTFLTVLGIVSSIPFNPWTDPNRVVMGWLGQLWGRGTMWVIPRVTIEARGFEHLGKGPVMMVANHNSVSDTTMLLAALPAFKFLVKSSMFFLPPLGIHLWLAGYIRAGTGAEGDSQRVIDDCVKWLKRGSHVLWFPEGTRSSDGKVNRFKSGAFYAAKQAGVKVVPVAISGTREVLYPRTLRFIFKGRIQITLLPGFTVDGEPKDAADQARELVMNQVAAQRATE
jgi:1-acyl-sn-glycerol-3-phosphate acyltransferase